MHSLVIRVNNRRAESVSERQVEDHRQIDLLGMPIWITVLSCQLIKKASEMFTHPTGLPEFKTLSCTSLVRHSRRTNLDLDEPAIDDQACDLHERTNRLHGIPITAKELLVTAIETGEV